MSSRRRPQNVFHGDVLKTSLRRLKTSSKLFLVNAKDHQESIYELSIYVRFKLFTYYHSITRQTNWINLNKLNTLKLGNNAEVKKNWFSMNGQTKKHFSQEFKYFLASEFGREQRIKPVTLKVWKTFPKRLWIRKLGFCKKTLAVVGNGATQDTF